MSTASTCAMTNVTWKTGGVMPQNGKKSCSRRVPRSTKTSSSSRQPTSATPFWRGCEFPAWILPIAPDPAAAGALHGTGRPGRAASSPWARDFVETTAIACHIHLGSPAEATPGLLWRFNDHLRRRMLVWRPEPEVDVEDIARNETVRRVAVELGATRERAIAYVVGWYPEIAGRVG